MGSLDMDPPFLLYGSLGSMLVLSATLPRSWYERASLLEIIWGQGPLDSPIAFLPDPDPYKIKVQFAALTLPLRSRFLLNSLFYSLCNMILSIIGAWPFWPEPTDCTMGLSDHSGWIKEAESSFHSLSTPSQ